MSEWISVKDRLPELPEEGSYPSVHVLVARRYSQCWAVGEAAWVHQRGAGTVKARIPRWERGGRIYEGVTHWQPLPAPPEPEVAQERRA